MTDEQAQLWVNVIAAGVAAGGLVVAGVCLLFAFVRDSFAWVVERVIGAVERRRFLREAAAERVPGS
jgi:hypothetical protein